MPGTEQPGVPDVRVSFVILSFNSAYYIERCIRSVVAECRKAQAPAEVWVVENGSRDDSVAVLHRLCSEYPDLLEVIFLPHNAGTTVSRNLALRRATGRYLVIMDSDVEVPPDLVVRLLKRLDANPTCGILVPKLIYPDGRFQLSTDAFPTVGHKLRRLVRLRAMEREAESAESQGQLRAVDYAISAFWLLRRDVMEKVGLFDEEIFYSPEDVDYCLRTWKAGYSVLYDPTVHAVHDAHERSRSFPLGGFTWSHISGLLYLFLKHRYAFSRKRLYRQISRFSD